MKLQPFALLLLGVGPAASSFSLSPWESQLASATSEACRAAFAAPIDCEETLLQLVTSGLFLFSQQDPLERTCKSSCKSALDKYVQNVKDTCTAPGDGVLVKDKKPAVPQVPVETVGMVAQYVFAWGCARDENKRSKWCYKHYGYGRDPYYAKSEFPCTAVCSVKAMEAAHNYPGSSFQFRSYRLTTQSPWWRSVYAEGWNTVLKCRDESVTLVEEDGAQVIMGNPSVTMRPS